MFRACVGWVSHYKLPIPRTFPTTATQDPFFFRIVRSVSSAVAPIEPNIAMKQNREKLVRTKIVATLGPASDSREKLIALIKAGVDVVRLNFSHGEYEYHRKVFNLVRDISKEFDHQVAILCDIQGPKIRTGIMEKPFSLAPRQKVIVTSDKVVGTANRFTITYETMYEDLVLGDFIYINDGIVKLQVTGKIAPHDLECVVLAGGDVSDRKGCNIPSGNLSIIVPTPKDRKDLDEIAKLDPEYVAASFVGKAQDVINVREHLAKAGNPRIKIISKMERPVAITNMDEIVAVSDGLMVARGDLGVEIDGWDVPKAQKDMCTAANRAGIPVIVATQMLESMIHNSRPTRAEISDVFNAVWDGADAVMLSGETSVGQYAVESVAIMDRIVETAEKQMSLRNPDKYDSHCEKYELTETVGHSVFTLARDFFKQKLVASILVISESGRTARMASKYRPPLNAICITPNLRTARELNLVWGVRSHYSDRSEITSDDIEKKIAYAAMSAHALGLISSDDYIVSVLASQLPASWAGAAGSLIGVYKAREVLNSLSKQNLNASSPTIISSPLPKA